MANLIPTNRSEAISSYDYFDIISGTGVQTFYGGKVMFLSGSSLVSGMILSPEQFYSENITSKATVASTSLVNVLNKNFDLAFETTRIVNGDVVVSLPIGMNSLSNVSIGNTYADIYLYKVDSRGTETLVVSGATMVYSASFIDNDEAHSKISNLSLPVSNQVFRKDEKLRLQVRLFSNNTASATAYQAGIAHDPKNRLDFNEWKVRVLGSDGPIIEDTTVVASGRFTTDTNMLVLIPFKLEVDI